MGLALLDDIEDKIYEGVNDVVTDLAKEINEEFEKIVKLTVRNALRIEQCIKKNISNGKELISKAFDRDVDGLKNSLLNFNSSISEKDKETELLLNESNQLLAEEGSNSIFSAKLEANEHDMKLNLTDIPVTKIEGSVKRDRLG